MTTHSDAFLALSSTGAIKSSQRLMAQHGRRLRLRATAQVEGEERQAAERLLLERMKSRGGWREIEALAAAGERRARSRRSGRRGCGHRHCATACCCAARAAEQMAEWGRRYPGRSLHSASAAREPHERRRFVRAGCGGPLSHRRESPQRPPQPCGMGADGDRPGRQRLRSASSWSAAQPFDWNQRPFVRAFPQPKIAERNLRAHAWSLAELVGEIPE